MISLVLLIIIKLRFPKGKSIHHDILLYIVTALFCDNKLLMLI